MQTSLDRPPTADASRSGERRLVDSIKVVFLGLSLLAVVIKDVPSFPYQMQAAAHGFANLIGQEHGWRMFSADPPGPSINFFAVLVDNSDRARTWSINRDRLGGDLAYYHWVKWVEFAALAPEQAKLSGLADWLIAESHDPVSELIVVGQITDRRKPPLPVADTRVITLFRTSTDD